jgi:hypothetical protein
MELKDLTTDNFIDVVSDAAQRKELIEALRQEYGAYPPLINHCWKLAESCKATPEQLRHVTHELMKLKGKKGDYDNLLCLFVRHPAIPEDVLKQLVDQKRCICDLGHLGGPQWLLESVAEEEENAITSLALFYYSQESYDTEKFAAFLDKHKEDEVLKEVMTSAAGLPEDKWQAVYKVFQEDNRS